MRKTLTTILLISLFFFIIISVVYKLSKIEVNPKDLTTGPANSGVIINQNIPEPTGFITDQANLLNPETKTKLNEILTNFNATNKGEVGILTIQNMNGLNIEEFGIRVAEKWKVGKAGIDNGIIIIIAISERKVRIEVGRGSTITDSQAGQILDEKMVPFLKKNDWNNAILEGTNEIINKLNK